MLKVHVAFTVLLDLNKTVHVVVPELVLQLGALGADPAFALTVAVAWHVYVPEEFVHPVPVAGAPVVVVPEAVLTPDVMVSESFVVVVLVVYVVIWCDSSPAGFQRST